MKKGRSNKGCNIWKGGFVEWFSIQKYSGSRISVQPEECLYRSMLSNRTFCKFN